MSDKEKLAQWMIKKGYATGHGDSMENLLHELEWQIAENWRGQRSADSEIPTLDETSTLEMWLNITKRIEAAIDFHRRSVLLVERGKESSRPTPLD